MWANGPKELGYWNGGDHNYIREVNRGRYFDRLERFIRSCTGEAGGLSFAAVKRI
jgi:hypothetical protein